MGTRGKVADHLKVELMEARKVVLLERKKSREESNTVARRFHQAKNDLHLEEEV